MDKDQAMTLADQIATLAEKIERLKSEDTYCSGEAAAYAEINRLEAELSGLIQNNIPAITEALRREAQHDEALRERDRLRVAVANYEKTMAVIAQEPVNQCESQEAA